MFDFDFDFPLTDSDDLIDPGVDYTCVGLLRDDVLAPYNEDIDDDSIYEPGY